MKMVVALGVPKGAPLLRARELVNLASASAIGFWLVAVLTIFLEASTVMGAILPANGTNTMISIFAGVVANCAIFLHALGTIR